MKTFTRPVEAQGHWGKGQGVDKNTFLHKSFFLQRCQQCAPLGNFDKFELFLTCEKGGGVLVMGIPLLHQLPCIIYRDAKVRKLLVE